MRGNTKKFALKSAVAVAATAAMVVPMAACGSGTAGGGKTKISFYSYFKDNQIGEVVKGFEKKNPDLPSTCSMARIRHSTSRHCKPVLLVASRRPSSI